MKTLTVSLSQNTLYSPNHTSFKAARTIPKPKVMTGMLETTLAAAAVYGMAAIGVVANEINKGLNDKEEEKSPFIETVIDGKFVSIKMNPKGEEEYRMIVEQSNLAGEYNITQIFPNGETKNIASAEKLKGKGFNIQKDFVSPAGYQTLYKRSGNNNDYQMSYLIKDKDGNTKLDFTRSFKKIDNDTTESVVNGKKHINTFGMLGVDSINQDNPEDKNFYIYNWMYEKNMKKLPAEIFYCLEKNNIRILNQDFENEHNACVHGHLLELSTQLKNDFFVIGHEVGHIKSYELGDLSKDEKLQKIFTQEREDAIKNMGEVVQAESGYFIDNCMGLERGLNEVAAETYAILSGLDHNGVNSGLGMRTNLLMQFFPKTITYIANKFYNINIL